MKLRSFAKVNLGLEIEGVMPDGYHRIKTIFQSIDFFDILTFEIINSGIQIEGNRRDIPWNEENLIYKAIDNFKREFGVKEGVRVYVEKRIPPGAGLGGGSSNAACSLIAMKEFFFNRLETKELFPLASRLGADVPYFLYGGTCLGEGKGDIIKEIKDLENLYFFLVLPEIKITSKEAYTEWDKSRLTFLRKNYSISKLEEQFNLEYLKNDLEEVVLKKYKELKEIKMKLEKENFRKVMMSGSGSCIFGITDDPIKAEKLRDKFAGYRVEIVKSIGREEYWKRIFID